MENNYLVSQLKNSSTKQNYIISAIMYSLNELNDVEKNIIINISKIEKYLNNIYKKNYSLQFISKVMIYLYNSYRIIINLPHMLDKINDKGKPCIHIIYSEMVSQLASVTLYSEAINILNNLNNTINTNRNKIICDNFNIISSNSLKINPNLIISKGHKFKTLLQEDYDNRIKILNDKIYDLCINIYKHTNDFSNDYNKIKNLKNKLKSIIETN